MPGESPPTPQRICWSSGLQAVQYDRDSPEIVKLLLARGASVTAVAEGQTAVTTAARRGETELTKMLREAEAAARNQNSRQQQ